MTQEYSNQGTKKYFGGRKERFTKKDANNKSENILEKDIAEEIILVEPNPLMVIAGMYSEINRLFNQYVN